MNESQAAYAGQPRARVDAVDRLSSQEATATVGHEADPQLQDLHWSYQLDLRFSDFLCIASLPSCERTRIPCRVVRRVARYANARTFCLSEDGKPAEKPAEYSSCTYDPPDCRRWVIATLHSARQTLGSHGASRSLFHFPRDLDDYVPRVGRIRETRPLLRQREST
jgi:hypothetical protein